MTPKNLQAKQARFTKKDPSEAWVWMRDIRRSVSYVARDRILEMLHMSPKRQENKWPLGGLLV